MKLLGILVVAAAALGFWVHDQRAKKAGEPPASARTVVAAGFKPYAPQPGAAPRKARVTGLRLITPGVDFQKQVANADLDQFIRRVEEQSADVLRAARQGAVQMQFTAGVKEQAVQVQAQGGIDGALLQALHDRLLGIERLKVKSSFVVFELQLAVAP